MAVMRALVFLFLVFSVECAPAEEDCPYGWTPFGVQCYKFFSESVNWATAEKNCLSVDANLASVRSTVEHNFLLSLVPGTTTAWTGGHDGEIDGQWLWSDGSQFDFTSWCSGEPNNYQGKPENCLLINFTTEEDCPYGWTPFGVQCYKFFSQSVNWATAEKNCLSVDANLASVRNTVEHNFLLSLVPGTTPAWTGGHDGEIDGQWLWSDGSQFDFTSWCSGEPNNYQGNPENCLLINFTNNHCWNDGQCSSTMSYICAKPLRS